MHRPFRRDLLLRWYRSARSRARGVQRAKVTGFGPRLTKTWFA